jgi:hypothetical protein
MRNCWRCDRSFAAQHAGIYAVRLQSQPASEIGGLLGIFEELAALRARDDGHLP